MGAHLNYGLGLSFLRHIERSKILVFVIDASKAKPHIDLYTLLRELELYDPRLLEKPGLVLANKIDRFSSAAEAEERICEIKEKIPDKLKSRLHVYGISAKYGFSVTDVTYKLKAMVAENDQKQKQHQEHEEQNQHQA